MPKITINDRQVHFLQMGHGADLVLIHGLFSNLAFWHLNIMPRLAKDFKVTAYDLRGHGYSSMPKDGYTTRHLADDLHALLDCLHIPRAHLAGHSFGGTVALHYTILHPDRVLSLSLADARIQCLQPPLPPRNAVYWNALRRRLQRAGIPVPNDLPRIAYTFLEEIAQRGLPRRKRWRARRDAAAQLHVNGRSRLTKRWCELVQTTSAAGDFCEVSGLTAQRIRQVTQPVLAIFGEYSNCLPTLRGLKQNVPRCQNVIVSGAGHLHPMLKPDAFVDNFKNFVLNLEKRDLCQ